MFWPLIVSGVLIEDLQVYALNICSRSDAQPKH